MEGVSIDQSRNNNDNGCLSRSENKDNDGYPGVHKDNGTITTTIDTLDGLRAMMAKCSWTVPRARMKVGTWAGQMTTMMRTTLGTWDGTKAIMVKCDQAVPRVTTMTGTLADLQTLMKTTTMGNQADAIAKTGKGTQAVPGEMTRRIARGVTRRVGHQATCGTETPAAKGALDPVVASVGEAPAPDPAPSPQ